MRKTNDEYLSEVMDCDHYFDAMLILSEWVRELRGKRNRADVCRQVGIAPHWLNRIENCRGIVAVLVSAKIDAHFGCGGKLHAAIRHVAEWPGRMTSGGWKEEPTLEELEALIQRQRKTMPRAWDRDEGGEMCDLRGRVRAPRVVKLPQTFRRAMHDKNRRTDWY